MTRESAQDVAQRWCDALAGRGLLAVEGALEDASVLHVPGDSGLAGQYQGGEAILGVLGRMAELTDGTLRTEPSRVLAANDQSIVLCGRANGTRRGKRLDAETVYVVSFRDTKVREIWVFHPNQDLVDAFWST